VCGVVTGNNEADKWFWLIENFVIYCGWQYPFFFIFWLNRLTDSFIEKKLIQLKEKDNNSLQQELSAQFFSETLESKHNKSDSLSATLTISDMQKLFYQAKSP